MICSALLTTFLLFGDSRCLIGYPTTPTLGALIQANCPGVTVYSDCRVGRGVFQIGAGTTLTPMQELTAKLAATPVQACLLALGVNDWHAPGGWATPQAVADGLKEMGDACIAAGAQPVIVTAFPASDGSFPTRGAWNAEVRMRQIALGAAMGWRVIDSWDAFDERTWHTGCTVTNGTPDGVHPWAQSCRQTAADYIAARLP